MPSKKRKRKDMIENISSTAVEARKTRIEKEINFHLKMAYILRDHKDCDKKKIDLEIIEQAVRGNMESQFKLAVYYHNGIGIKLRERKTLFWLLRSAEQGHAAAQFNAGLCCEKGRGVRPNPGNAFRFMHQSALQNHMHAQYNLGVYYLLGIGTKKNEKAAMQWMLKSALQGCMYAQYNMGVYYQKAIGVEKDESSAFYWLLKSAEQGFSLAQLYVGQCYKDGLGVDQDESMFLKWTKESSKQGLPIAQRIIKRHNESYRDTKKNNTTGMKRHKQLSAHANMRAHEKNNLFLEQSIKLNNIKIEANTITIKQETSEHDQPSPFQLSL